MNAFIPYLSDRNALALQPTRQLNAFSDGAITQGHWMDFWPAVKAAYEGGREMLGVAPSERVINAFSRVQSPVLRPQNAFEWADYGAGVAADTLQTGLAAADIAGLGKAIGPAAGRRFANAMMDQSGQVDVWHGSPYKFDKVSHEKIGTGEGAQAFGWGTYYTDKADIAKNYAKNLGGKIVDGVPFKYNAYEDLTKHGFTSQEAMTINDVAWLYKGDYKEFIKEQEQTIKFIKEGKLPGTRRARSVYKDASDNELINILQKKIDAAEKYGPKIKDEGNVYRAQLFPGKDPSEYTFLDWYENVNQNKYKEVLDLAYKEFGADHPAVDALMKMNPSVRNVTGEGLYHTLSAQLGKGGRDINGQREASLFLKRAGIDGIRYPTETLSGKGAKGGGAFNYVVFDEKDVRLVSRESGGAVEDLTPNYKDQLLSERQGLINKIGAIKDDYDSMIEESNKITKSLKNWSK